MPTSVKIFMTALEPFIRLARPGHYLKNGFVFVPLFFAHRFFHWPSLMSSLVAFTGFSLAASVVYVVNDIVDRHRDAQHPLKRTRPIAAGRITVTRARRFGLVLTVLTAGCCLLVYRADYFLIIVLYMLLNLLYTIRMQHRVGLGAVCVAFGFVLRVFAGAVVIAVPVSGWLATLTFLLALFLALSKRRCEAQAVGHAAAPRQPTVPGALVIFMAAACLAGYVFYTLSPAVVREHGAPRLYLSAVWVALGLYRYLRVVFHPTGDCSPVAVLLKDRVLQLIVVLWIFSLWWMLYAAPA